MRVQRVRFGQGAWVMRNEGWRESYKSGCLDFHLVGLDCCLDGVVGVLVADNQ